MSRPTVIGVDLSLSATGFAGWDENDDRLRLDTWTTTPSQPLVERLDHIHAQVVAEVCASADLVVIEDFVTRSPAASLLGMVHGVVRLTLHHSDDRVLLVPPSILKAYACGRGNATKADMRVSLLQRAGIDVRDDNQCDAAWLRMLGLDLLGAPEVTLPAGHRRALDKLQEVPA